MRGLRAFRRMVTRNFEYEWPCCYGFRKWLLLALLASFQGLR